MYWRPEKETMERGELEQLQLERLQATISRVYRNVPFYRKKFDEADVDPDGFRLLSELRKLPFTTKEDLRSSYPYGMFATPLREVVRLHASAGTTGTPTVVGYTKNDIKIWSHMVARILTAGGITHDDVIQIAFGYGLFTGGFGIHYGAELIGASVIPISSGDTARQVKIMQDFKTTALICTPSYALMLADAIDEMAINVNSLSLRCGFFGGKPWSEMMRQELQDRLKIIAIDNYGLSEVNGPGVAGECIERNGMHINEDHFLVEVVNPHTMEPVAPGEAGELVLTTLTKEAFPLIRFRTRDLTRLITEPCPCGRTFVKMSRVMGRTDDMLVIQGENVFPCHIGTVLADIRGAESCYQIIVNRTGALDDLTVAVEVAEAIISDERKQQELISLIKNGITAAVGISVTVKLLEKGSLGQTEGKAKTVLDLRKC